jgi:phosphatidylethanolamine-binding protein (PEBP) family uncharacterized protein
MLPAPKPAPGVFCSRVRVQHEERPMAFRLTSKAFKEGDVLPQGQVFNGMGHAGANLSPQLQWEGAP